LAPRIIELRAIVPGSADGSPQYKAEFERLEARSEKVRLVDDYSTAKLEENGHKNRYKNVLAPEASRVVLNEVEGCSNYINASYIDGLLPGTERAYIGSQGPLLSTTPEFWRMVWERNCSVIVMLTKEVELNKSKCDKYWPDEGESEDYPPMRVTSDKTEHREELSIRHFTLSHREFPGESRKITHLQYVVWPDQGVPKGTTGFLNLLKDSDEANTSHGPLVVHCSAGVGRTGCFCVSHAILAKVRADRHDYPLEEPKVNIPDTMIKMRLQRPNLVQTPDQYIFCYIAIYDGARKIMKKKAKQVESPSN